MKLKSKFFIVAVIFLFVLAVNVASADENVTDAIDDGDAAIDENVAEIDVPSKVWVNGNDNITINSKESAAVNITGAVNYSGNIASGESKVPLKNLTVGKHNLFLSYLSNTTSFQKEFNLTVMKDSPYWDMDLVVENGEKLVLSSFNHYPDRIIEGKVVNVPKGLTGELNFYINDYLVDRYNITGKYYHSDYDFADNYYGASGTILNFRVEYLGDDYFKPVNKTARLETTELVAINIPSQITLGHDDDIIIDSVYYQRGSALIYIDGELFAQKEFEYDKEALKDYIEWANSVEYDIDPDDIDGYDEEGVTFNDWYRTDKISLNHLKPGKSYDVKVIFNFKNKNGEVYRNITKQTTVFVYNSTDDYVRFQSASFYDYRYGMGYAMNIYAPHLDFDIELDGKPANYSYSKNGYFIVNFDGIAPGFHEISVSYEGDSFYLKNTFYKTFYVPVSEECEFWYDSQLYEIYKDYDSPKAWYYISAKDVSMNYGDKSTVDINVYKNNRAVGAGEIVRVDVGSNVYFVSTDKNGVARLKIDLLPGKYTVKATYMKEKSKSKLTVKNVLTFKKVKVKRSAKKLVLTAKLSKKIKGKKITFKFKGKKYSAKTDKKGVAKVTIKKSVLKKLKVGKKVSLSATYIKLTKKFTVKVQK